MAFDAWVSGVRAGTTGGGTLDRATYLQLDRPSEKVPVIHYAAVAPDLFDAVVNMCVRPGKLCNGQMAAIDARGGTGRQGLLNVAALTTDDQGQDHVTSAAPGFGAATLRKFVRDWCADNRPLRAAVARVPQVAVNAPRPL